MAGNVLVDEWGLTGGLLGRGQRVLCAMSYPVHIL